MDLKKLTDIQEAAIKEIEKVASENDLEKLRIKYLGRKSDIALFLRDIKNLPENEKRLVGQKANDIRKLLEAELEKKKQIIEKEDIDSAKSKNKFDVTAPGVKIPRGHLHPLTLVINEIEDIFTSMGFDIVEGSEIENEWYNFEVLNIPSDHPARDMQDTFWLKQLEKDLNDTKRHMLPRTHTSATQVRFMEKHQPPFSIIVPGRIFRNEATDTTHEMQFTQFEGLMVGKDISVAHMKGVVEYFFNRFFKEKLEFRYVANYFPYTEPSLEINIKGKKGAIKNKWLEVAGAGMVHQKVFKNAGYLPNEWQGFAWGFGVDRLAMLKYKIDDVRLFYGNDLRFLKQF